MDDNEETTVAAPTAADLHDLEVRVSQVLETMHATYQARFGEQEEKLDNYEQQLAILAMAYAEAAVMIEALIAQLQFATDEAREKFHETMRESRKHMVDVMTTHANVEPEDTGTGPPVAGVDESDDSASTG